MRNKKRIEQLEMHVMYLSQHIELMSNALLELLEKEDEREQAFKDIEAGKWYKNP